MTTNPSEPSGLTPVPPARSDERSLLDVLRVAIIMLDERGTIRLWSPMARELLGWHDRDAVGRRLTELLAPDHAPATVGRIHATLRQRRHWRGPLRLRHRDGHIIPLEGRAALLLDAGGTPFILANLVETSRMTGIEQDLAAFDALFTASALGIGIFDTDQRLVRVNEALARMHDATPDDLLGKTLLDILPTPSAQRIHALQNDVLRTGNPVTDLVVQAADGVRAHSMSFGRLTDRDGRPVGVSSTVMDVTARREALSRIERARQRLAMLDDIGSSLGDLLDVHLIAGSLAQLLVPRFADYTAVELLAPVAEGNDLPSAEQLPDTPVLQLGTAAKQHSAQTDTALEAGETITFEPGSPFSTVLRTGHPLLIDSLTTLGSDSPKVRAALDLGVHSMLILPLRARGTVLGLIILTRAGQRAAFDREDEALAMEVAGRAAISLDNARLYARERESALTLQRSLLPQSVPQPPGVAVSHRYVPGSVGTEVGGDWFDVIPLAGGRVAFVVGDVMGHGLRAAATMGRLRTAVRTLAGLELAPAELLRRVDDLSEDLAQAPDDQLWATCLYAVYDPASRECVLAKAGHLPPVLLTRDDATGLWSADPLDLPSGAPLGVGGVPFEERRITVPEGSVLVLYTDGLIETRGESITVGLERLCTLLSERGTPGGPLDELCDRIVEGLTPDAGPGGGAPGPSDDIALLAARLHGLPDGSAADWVFAPEPHAPRKARRAVRRALLDWNLEPLVDTTVLLVSELVTNSLRYAPGPVGVRMVRGTSLLVEVSDLLPDPPQERTAALLEEGGRGLRLVARQARRWGTRQSPDGKTVWFELLLP
ncbi:SpoIIE family protein phosphatase [Streptomyces sp. NPDC059853]|uniref:SpoIIE family protein phosphatase n=1 Tax=Streptomyces sp. NPDC059853 TaxID=3346973 RepID=UPI003663FF47